MIKLVEDVVYKLALPIAAQFDCEVVEVEYKKEGSEWFLRVYIDKEGGVFISDCEDVSRALSTELDRIDPIERQYILEVSSPGIERRLKTEKDFKRYIGKKIQIKLYKAINRTKKLVGILEEYHDDTVSIRAEDGSVISVDIKDASKINLKADFF